MCSRFIQTFGNVSYILCLNWKWRLYIICGVLVKMIVIYTEAVQLCCSLDDTLSQMVYLAITAGLDCSHLNRYICIKLQVLVVLFKRRRIEFMHRTKAASSRALHSSLFRVRWNCSTLTQGNLCWKPKKSKVIPVLDIFKTWARKKLHLCSIIISAAASPLWWKCQRPYLTLSTPWPYDAPQIFCTRSRKCLKDHSTRQPSIQY